MAAAFEIDAVERKRRGGLFAADELDGRDLADVAGVDHRESLAADRHRVDAVSGHYVLDREFIVHEVRGAQDGGLEAHLLDHALDAELAREVRHVHVEVAVDHREVDNPLNTGFAGKVERSQGLGEFFRHHGIEQEQGRDP